MKILQYSFDHKSCQANKLIKNTYRIFEYSFVVKVIHSLSFRIFFLALIKSLYHCSMVLQMLLHNAYATIQDDLGNFHSKQLHIQNRFSCVYIRHSFKNRRTPYDLLTSTEFNYVKTDNLPFYYPCSFKSIYCTLLEFD